MFRYEVVNLRKKLCVTGGEVGERILLSFSPAKKESINYKAWMASSEDLNTRL